MGFKNLLSAFGIHVHTWYYFKRGEIPYVTRYRRCECGQVEEWVAVPAAPGAFVDWMRIEPEEVRR